MKGKKNYRVELIEEGKLSHYRVTTNQYGEEIRVPVIDARDGIVERIIALGVIKRSNSSKYMTYNEYHRSHKTKKNLSI
jgi:hypothetical protein